MANVRQIAKRAGVSITTVSRVLNNHPRVSIDARDRVLAATNATGYVPTVGRKSSTNIAFAYTGESSLGSPFDAALMQGMVRGMEEYAYDLMVLDVRRARLAHETYSQMFLRRGVRAAVLRTTAQTRHVCQAIADEGFPAIVIGDRFGDDEPNVSFVDCESRTPSREAVEHLIGLGHRRIAIAINIVDDSDHADRLAGWRDALAEHGIEPDDKLVIRAPAWRGGGVQVMRRLATMVDPPTAVYLTDPLTAVGAVNEARKMGVRIPEDLSVVAFDDAEVRFGLSPEMTAVCQDAAALGGEAFAALHRMVDAADGVPVIRRRLRAWLEIHDSTAPAPGGATQPPPAM
jgi:DNA-binding LacI/PurR family transcriptional regulator